MPQRVGWVPVPAQPVFGLLACDSLEYNKSIINNGNEVEHKTVRLNYNTTESQILMDIHLKVK